MNIRLINEFLVILLFLTTLPMISAITYTLFQHFFTERSQVQVGDQAPNFVLEDMEGNKVQLSDFKGRGVFWISGAHGANMRAGNALYGEPI